jgi:hypothetical protein
MKCGYCKDKIALAHNGFSGIKLKFCQSCWHKIYNVSSALQRLEQEPQLLNFVLKIH